MPLRSSSVRKWNAINSYILKLPIFVGSYEMKGALPEVIATLCPERSQEWAWPKSAAAC